MKILVTGGAGFIGSAFIRHLIGQTSHHVCNLDKLTYAASSSSLATVQGEPRYQFVEGDICDFEHTQSLFRSFQPDAVVHLAAESHVDRSIENPRAFIDTNITGTFNLLAVARDYWNSLSAERQKHFRFHHVSTDEVYGELPLDSEKLFTESTPYAPSSPYSASKAAADHLVRAWNRTYGLPVLITNCSNNYGPYQFPEKLIPHTILNALAAKEIPIYGTGEQVRDWLYVDDHARALTTVLEKGAVGETYNIGGHNEVQNIEIVKTICSLLEELACDQKPPHLAHFSDLITHVPDRPGHDQRYAIDASKVEQELGCIPTETLQTGLRKTVQWYLNNPQWSQSILANGYKLERKGLQ